MIRFTVEDTIARPAHDIWAYAAEIMEHPAWMAVTDPRILSGSSRQVGSRGREVLHVAGRRYDVEFEVTAAEAGRIIAWRSLSGAPFDLSLTLELVAVTEAVTRAMYSGTVRLKGLWRLFTPFVAMETRRGPAAELRRLKQVMETQP